MSFYRKKLLIIIKLKKIFQFFFYLNVNKYIKLYKEFLFKNLVK